MTGTSEKRSTSLGYLQRKNNDGVRVRSVTDVEALGLAVERAVLVADRIRTTLAALEPVTELAALTEEEPAVLDVPCDDPHLWPLEQFAERAKPFLAALRPIIQSAKKLATEADALSTFLKANPVIRDQQRSLTSKQLIAAYVVRIERTKLMRTTEPQELKVLLRAIEEIPEQDAPRDVVTIKELLKKTRGAKDRPTYHTKKGKPRGELLAALEREHNRRVKQGGGAETPTAIS